LEVIEIKCVYGKNDVENVVVNVLKKIKNEESIDVKVYSGQ
jgi:hypothetical protein